MNTERRRRAAAAAPRDDSRLGALGLDGAEGDEPLTEFGPGFGDSSQLDAEAGTPRPARNTTLPVTGTRARVLRTYAAARVVVGVALLLAQGLVADPALLRGWLSLALMGLYLTEAVLLWGWFRRQGGQPIPARAGRWLWWTTIGWDLLSFGAMHWFDPVGSLSHAALLVLPVLMAGVLSSRTTGLATAAVAALGMLAMAVLRGQTGELPGLLSQAGLVGIGLFMIVLVAGEMANRLARQEVKARHNLALALQQAELNRLVIDEMGDGVLVVDRRGGVRAANPAARALLAENDRCPRAPFSLHGQRGWLPLLGAIESAYEAGHWPAGGNDLTVAFDREAPRSVRVRARFTRRAGAGRAADEVLAVLFVEELRSVLARQRQERLVAMGRISAGIAHEIRNPLAAISQANALLQEDHLRPDQQRLARIIGDNVERLKRIVDDVMEAAPGAPVPSRPLDLAGEVSAICSEWARTAGVALGGDSRLQVRLPTEPVGGLFDPDHLRRVLVNLLENGLRHAGRAAGAVQVSIEPVGPSLVRLCVASDGEPIAAEVEAHLFEPFHSTRSRGTGLGLYICRELCERHGASIDYLRRPGERHANLFQVVMRSAPVDGGGRLHL